MVRAISPSEGNHSLRAVWAEAKCFATPQRELSCKALAGFIMSALRRIFQRHYIAHEGRLEFDELVNHRVRPLKLGYPRVPLTLELMDDFLIVGINCPDLFLNNIGTLLEIATDITHNFPLTTRCNSTSWEQGCGRVVTKERWTYYSRPWAYGPRFCR
jgi:hypothetical protein